MILDKFLGRLSAREKMLFLAGIFAVAVCLADSFVVGPVVKRLRRMDVEIKDARRNLVINEGILSRGIPKEYQEIGSVLERTGSPGETINIMKDEIDALSKKSGIELSSMEGRDPVPKERCEKYAVEVGKLETSMRNIITLLHALQTSPEMLTVSKLSLSAVKDSNQVKGSMLITRLMIPSATAQSDTK